MKKSKEKNIKYETMEQKEVKKFAIVLLGLIIVIGGIYLFTRAFVTKDLFKSESIEYTDGVINYDTAIVGNMLNRPYDEYYAIAFDKEDTKSSYYNTIINNYKKNENSIKIYYIDLSNELNKKYIASDEEKITTKYDGLENLKLGKISLFNIKSGKVVKMITNIDEIKKELIS